MNFILKKQAVGNTANDRPGEDFCMADIVSIVIPTYGANTNPCRAVNSVLSQDYKDVEVIVVDDNGKGTPQQTANEMLFIKYQKDPRFRYVVHPENRGGSVARNSGVAASKGKYLCFLDDDDEFTDPHKLSVQIKEAEGLGMDWAGTYSSCDIYKGTEFVRKVVSEKSGRILEEYMLDKVRTGISAFVITRTAYDAVLGFDGTFKRHQDWEFFARIFDQFQMKAVPEVTYSRYYKTDVARKSPEVRLAYMDKYAESMRTHIKSISTKKLEKIIRRKYMGIVFAMLRDKKVRLARQVIKENHFAALDYLTMIKLAINYGIMRLKYGSHF